MDRFFDTVTVTIILVLALLLSSLAYLSWYSSKRQAALINAEFGTHYTTSDVFFTNDLPKEIQKIKRQTIRLTTPQKETKE